MGIGTQPKLIECIAVMTIRHTVHMVSVMQTFQDFNHLSDLKVIVCLHLTRGQMYFSFMLGEYYTLAWRKVTHCSGGSGTNLSPVLSTTSESLVSCIWSDCNPLHNLDQRITAGWSCPLAPLWSGLSASLLSDYSWLSQGDQGQRHLRKWPCGMYRHQTELTERRRSNIWTQSATFLTSSNRFFGSEEASCIHQTLIH